MVKSKDVIFFEDMYEQHYAVLCTYANSYVKDSSIAEDIVSETFFTLWKNKEKLKPIKSIKAYLFRSIHNNCLCYLRDNDKDLKSAKLTFEFLQAIPSSDINAIDSIIIKELSDQIEKALGALPPQQQNVFRLKRIEHKKNKEIAQELNIAVKTVEMHMSNAVKSLKGKLQNLSGHPKTILIGILIAEYLDY